MSTQSLRDTTRITKALADPHRLRVLMLLQAGELCVCQIVDVLDLAASTVSKHLSLLAAADLVVSRKDGRWAYYRLPDPAGAGHVQPVLDWLQQNLQSDGQILKDRRHLAKAVACGPETLRKRQRQKATRDPDARHHTNPKTRGTS